MLIYCIISCFGEQNFVQYAYADDITSSFGQQYTGRQIKNKKIIYINDYSYNYGSLCIFAQLVTGYVLPDLHSDWYKDTAHFTKQSLTTNKNDNTEIYIYHSAGISGEILKKGNFASFTSALIDAKKLPVMFSDKTTLLSSLQVANPKRIGDHLSISCEIYTINFYFHADRIDALRIFFASVD